MKCFFSVLGGSILSVLIVASLYEFPWATSFLFVNLKLIRKDTTLDLSQKAGKQGKF